MSMFVLINLYSIFNKNLTEDYLKLRVVTFHFKINQF